MTVNVSKPNKERKIYKYLCPALLASTLMSRTVSIIIKSLDININVINSTNTLLLTAQLLEGAAGRGIWLRFSRRESMDSVGAKFYVNRLMIYVKLSLNRQGGNGQVMFSSKPNSLRRALEAYGNQIN